MTFTLQQSYPSIDKNNWKNFIDNHFYLQYVDDEYELSPLTLNINEDESIVSFLDQLSGRIIERSVFRLNGTACTLQREGCPLQTGSF